MQGSSRFFTGASSQAIIRADYQFLQKRSEKIWSVRNFAYLCNPKTKEREVLTENGVIAQLVEQRTENPFETQCLIFVLKTFFKLLLPP